MTTTKTETKTLSFMQRRGVGAYSVTGAICLIQAWVLAGSKEVEFGGWALEMWGMFAASVLFFALAMIASEVRKTRVV